MLAAAGPSPRVRGILPEAGRRAARAGSIPAGAGNPRRKRPSACASRVHPRGCGESVADRRKAALTAGPSPRVRGIRHRVRVLHGRQGSIPAGAGNPAASARGTPAARVHPRGCGESQIATSRSASNGGPSPRVRGIHRRRVSASSGRRSIPAGAGNPSSWSSPTPCAGVHPRGCGESSWMPVSASSRQGPSPRVRGIRVGAEAGEVCGRSIPAGAGNP